MRHLLLPLLIVLGCRRAEVRPLEASVADSGAIREPTVVAFRLPAADTLTPDGGGERLQEFEAYTALVLPLLAEQGLRTRTWHAETLVVELTDGPSRTIMLQGLDYPYGYVLVEPGFAESILTGVLTDEELLDEASSYFGLDADSVGGERRPQIVLSRRAVLR